ncbi:MAG: hypothetical protein H8F28_05615 [Fibrella sp.]|nr:hypothetical protein [Armatimonadota bacterium]
MTKRLVVAGLPVALLVAWSVVSLAGRTLHNSLNKSDKQARAASERQAKTVAGSLIGYMTNDSVAPEEMQFSEQATFSMHRNMPVNDWNVVYNTKSGRQYLIRLNSATRQVYAVNLIHAEPTPLAIARPVRNKMSESEAQRYALHYLKCLGGDIDSISMESRTIHSPADEPGESQHIGGGDAYLFSYRRQISGGGERLVMIAINQETGGIDYYWNPSGAM